MAASKPHPGHKFNGIRRMFQSKCECGWEGGKWCGQGGMKNAVGEWHMHIDNCKRSAEK